MVLSSTVLSCASQITEFHEVQDHFKHACWFNAVGGVRFWYSADVSLVFMRMCPGWKSRAVIQCPTLCPTPSSTLIVFYYP